MADYHPLIARAVEGLDNSTGEARRGLYERARAALVAQLRSIEPALSEADITRERLALEDAIRKVEAESVRKARSERQGAPSLSATPPAARTMVPPAAPSAPRRSIASPGGVPPTPRAETPRNEPPPPRTPSGVIADEEIRPAAAGSARSRILSARTSPITHAGLKTFRDTVSEADDLGAASARSAQSARDTRDSYGTDPALAADAELAPLHEQAEPRFDDDSEMLDEHAPRPLDAFEDFADHDEPPPGARPAPRARAPEEHYGEPRRPRSYRGFAKFAVVLIIIAGLVATISWQWSNITGIYQFVSHMRSKPTQTAQAPAPEPKFSGRVPQEQLPGQPAQAPAGGGTTTQPNAPPVAQRVVLYEEDPNNPQGRQFVGSAVWRTETVSPGSGLAPELEVRADITIPERNMTVTWTLRRNTDQALPASHTVEIMFNLPSDFPGGGIANVPGVLMKDSEQARGVPLAGLAVKVTNGFFLIGLSAVPADVQRNVDLLKTRPWFDIPIVYNNGGRAILALEKGAPGDRAFADAFAAWAK
ncbi:MAG TPA: hypothetical protein VHY10_01685 [Xanthobacteraceae bacterium]|jgi:hypothetical protein|nr:hypothetical protein [Xanthobacteraceae bacterium]